MSVAYQRLITHMPEREFFYSFSVISQLESGENITKVIFQSLCQFSISALRVYLQQKCDSLGKELLLLLIYFCFATQHAVTTDMFTKTPPPP